MIREYEIEAHKQTKDQKFRPPVAPIPGGRNFTVWVLPYDLRYGEKKSIANFDMEDDAKLFVEHRKYSDARGD